MSDVSFPPDTEVQVYQMSTGRQLWAYRCFDGSWSKAPTEARALRYWAWEQTRIERTLVEPGCQGTWGFARPLGMTRPQTTVQNCDGCGERLVIDQGRAHHYPPGTTDAEIWESL